jgi:hypothetical protein
MTGGFPTPKPLAGFGVGKRIRTLALHGAASRAPVGPGNDYRDELLFKKRRQIENRAACGLLDNIRIYPLKSGEISTEP